MLRTRTGALLAELHAHTTWSDGSLPMTALVDLYGSRGFDVLCITDHVCRTDLAEATNGITATSYEAYLAEIDREARRAQERYSLLVLPGPELTYNDPDPDSRPRSSPSASGASSRSTTESTGPSRPPFRPAQR
jgi:histidinol phosphatase-like PHP family hydrolase